ncbi:MAG: hypothetical protein NTZ67_06320 [Gammaproteobacteria bacterium]|nr:hypothetical protein [Gammaproteobacteria bacterium]
MRPAILYIDINCLFENSNLEPNSINSDMLLSLSRFESCTQVIILHEEFQDGIRRVMVGNESFELNDKTIGYINAHPFFKPFFDKAALSFSAFSAIKKEEVEGKRNEMLFISRNENFNEKVRGLGCETFYRPAISGEVNLKDFHAISQKINDTAGDESLIFMLDFDDTIIHFNNDFAHLNTHLIAELAKLILQYFRKHGDTKKIEFRILSARAHDNIITASRYPYSFSITLINDALPLFFEHLKRKIATLATEAENEKIAAGDFDLTRLTVLPHHCYCLNGMIVMTQYTIPNEEPLYIPINPNLTEAENLTEIENYRNKLRLEKRAFSERRVMLNHTTPGCKAVFFRENLLPVMLALKKAFLVVYIDDLENQIDAVNKLAATCIATGRIYRGENAMLTYAPRLSLSERIPVPCYKTLLSTPPKSSFFASKDRMSEICANLASIVDELSDDELSPK